MLWVTAGPRIRQFKLPVIYLVLLLISSDSCRGHRIGMIIVSRYERVAHLISCTWNRPPFSITPACICILLDHLMAIWLIDVLMNALNDRRIYSRWFLESKSFNIYSQIVFFSSSNQKRRENIYWIK